MKISVEKAWEAYDLHQRGRTKWQIAKKLRVSPTIVEELIAMIQPSLFFDAPEMEPDSDAAYQILELRQGATRTEIKSAYRRASLLTHPDRGGSAFDFRRIQRAYEVLTRTA
jgi:DnaJ domain